MAFGDIGCGTNACWLKFILIYRMFCTVLFAGSALIRRTQSMTNRNMQFVDSPALSFVDWTFIALCVMNLYFHYMALKASSSGKCERPLWRRWSNYMKVLMIIVGVIGGLLAIVTLVAGVSVPGQTSGFGPLLMALTVVLITASWLVGEGLVLLLTKNRYEEKVQEEAERRGGEGEYLKPV